MRREEQVAVCAANNADWCAAIFRAHGLSYAIADGLWISTDQAPPYYPNVVTLSPIAPATQREIVLGLRDARRGAVAIKDSFGCLDLGGDGFQPLFDAEWLWLDADRPPLHPDDGVRWRRVRRADDLERWERAWQDDGSPSDRRVFPSGLLDEPVAILAASRARDESIVAGCVVSRAAGVLGWSNFFAGDEDREALRASALAAAMRRAPGLPIVGYESGAALAAAARLGFRALGRLRVWTATDA